MQRNKGKIRPTEYRIKLMARDERYGNCERCGKRCVPHYAQQWRFKDQKSPGWVTAGWGHVECLRNLNWSSASVFDPIEGSSRWRTE